MQVHAFLVPTELNFSVRKKNEFSFFSVLRNTRNAQTFCTTHILARSICLLFRAQMKRKRFVVSAVWMAMTAIYWRSSLSPLPPYPFPSSFYPQPVYSCSYFQYSSTSSLSFLFPNSIPDHTISMYSIRVSKAIDWSVCVLNKTGVKRSMCFFFPHKLSSYFTKHQFSDFLLSERLVGI